MQPFVHTLRSLKADTGSRASLGLLALLILTGALGAWLFLARIAVYEVSSKTRLELAGAAVTVHSEVPGKLSLIRAKLGQTVQTGDLLFELDASLEQRRLSSARTRLASLGPRIAETQKELDATLAAVKAESQTGLTAVQGARARAREARLQTQLAKSEAQRFSKLEGHVAEIEVERATATAQMREASADASKIDVQRLIDDRRARVRNGEARAAALRVTLVTLQGEQQALSASAAELEEIIEKRHIRAPSSGLIGELPPLHPGSFVAEGAKLATVLPSTDLILVAEFEPASALGRIKPTQPAQLRLTGFPWLEFGVVPARVTQVAGEVRDGFVRVELELLRDSRPLIPFQHGLPGTVEVQVERTSPAKLLLRSLGRRLEASPR
jgi:multidrug resistance efflux pump